MKPRTLAQSAHLSDALRALERAVELLKSAGEPLAAMKVSAVRGTFK